MCLLGLMYLLLIFMLLPTQPQGGTAARAHTVMNQSARSYYDAFKLSTEWEELSPLMPLIKLYSVFIV